MNSDATLALLAKQVAASRRAADEMQMRLDPFAGVLEQAQKAIRESVNVARLAEISEVLQRFSVKVPDLAGLYPWTDSLANEMARIVRDIDLSPFSLAVDRIQADFAPAINGLRVNAPTLRAIPQGATTVDLSDLLSRLPGAEVRPASPNLSRWIEATARGSEPPETELPTPEEIRPHWLSAVLWVFILTAVFASAARDQQWGIAREILGSLSDAAGLFLGLDWLMNKTMK